MARRADKVLDLAAVYRHTCRRSKQMSAKGELVDASGPFACDHTDVAPQVLVRQPSLSAKEDQEESEVSTACFRAVDSRPCTLALTSEDTASAATRLFVATGRPALALIFASRNLPGGAVASGVLAQEECLFRQTSISLCMPAGSRSLGYPLDPGRVVLCRNVSVIRGPHPSYEWLTPPFPLVDLVSAAAVQKPVLDASGDHYADGGADMRMRVASVLQAAMRNGSTHLVLGAWGCGGFRNPARGLAEVLRSSLVDDGFACCFEQVVFAIPGKDCRHTAFRSVFQDLLAKGTDDPQQGDEAAGEGARLS